VLILILLLRPNGLLGKRQAERSMLSRSQYARRPRLA
jgi:hypothetical protein